MLTPGEGDVMEITPRVSYYHLYPDGTYGPADVLYPAIYISETQLDSLRDPETSAYIRDKYGPTVGVIQNTINTVHPPIYPTFMYVLGG